MNIFNEDVIFFFNIFNPWLVDDRDGEPVDMER